MKNRLITSESVTEGHPDKICDQIADSILDVIIQDDPMAHVACEVCVTTGLVLVMGEITTTTYVDIPKIVRETVKEIGYNKGEYGFDADNLSVIVSIDEQSPDINMGVKDGDGAGDQGLMFGYATNENIEYMPTALMLSHKLVKKLSEVRKANLVNYLRPDGKSQVTVEYNDEGHVKRVDSIVISAQHSEDVNIIDLKKFIMSNVIEKVIDKKLIDSDTKIFINGTGRFVIGGPKGDSGLTGRKIIVDTYGGYAHHGGGSFSGKDPTKVDRSASYMARYIAKNIVATGVCEKIEIGLSYVIGRSEPTSIMIDTFGTCKVTDELIISSIKDNFNLTPKGIIDTLNLRRPIYKQTAAYGHMGRIELNLPWEELNKVDDLKKYFNRNCYI